MSAAPETIGPTGRSPGRRRISALTLWISVILLFFTAFGLAGRALAQDRPAGPARELSRQLRAGNLTPAQIDALLARVSDSEVRKILRDHLRDQAKQKAEGGGFLASIEASLIAFRTNLPKAFAALDTFGPSVETAWSRLSEPGIVLVLLALLVAIALGIGAEWLIRRAFRKSIGAMKDEIRAGKLTNLTAACGYLAVVETIGVIVFAAVTVAVFAIWMGGEAGPMTMFRKLFPAVVVIRLAMVLGRFMFAANDDVLRGNNLSKGEATRLHNAFVQMIAVMAILVTFFSYLGANGLAVIAWGLLITGSSLIVMPLIFRFIWLFSGPVARGMARHHSTGGEQLPFRVRLVAGSWHWFAMAYVALVLGINTVKALSGGEFVGGAAIYSLLLLPGLFVLDLIIGALIFGRKERARRRSVMRNILRFLMFIGAVVVFFRLWGLNLFSNVQDSLGPAISSAVLQVGIILIIAYLIWEMFRSWIDRRIAEELANQPEGSQEESEGPGGTGLSRLATLLPIVKSFVTVTFFIIAGLTVLRSLGVDIGPLLAGAGIIGLAIGFGSQTLVRDIVAGVFFLIDDAFRVGEYIESGRLKGSVERLGIRSIRLRHHRGMVHTIPYGELSAVTNYSRDWVIMKLEFRLPYGTDMEKVRKAIKKTGQEMATEEQFEGKLLAPLKSQGVVRTEQSSLVFRAKFTAKPGEQFLIRREAFRRIQEALEASGIDTYAPHQVEVHMAETGARSRAEAAAGAAATTVPGLSPPTRGD